ncbi:MAG: phosphoribosylaminoimidazolesuccinocarboxamide synthase [Ignavibacteriae bacterium]|nr:phosphoribosylaminoimidazolesuccinocarboxamide synthase [Ignavibacteria bacterium]MBI3364948.1 phosphoribosylaminoimidazolesuccinocarboxamide synthase [Ignavibacteriota bacterium]
MVEPVSRIPYRQSNTAVYETDFPTLHFLRRGKVRDVYDLGEHLLIVATDRLSAFDVVMPQPIPGKGKVLTQISNYWFAIMKDIIPNHIVATRVEDFPKECESYAEQLRGRSVVVKKAQPLPIECVVRGYLSGSGWNEYKESGNICGIGLPEGLVESSKLPEPIFTPATKADVGHDENISFERAAAMVGKDAAENVRDYSIAIYKRAVEIADAKGIIIADTKMEFGLYDGQLILIDELLTPDSSRFWPKDNYQPGRSQESFDKQYVRDYLLSIHFNKKPPGPQLPEEVIRKTSELYREALKKLTGTGLE